MNKEAIATCSVFIIDFEGILSHWLYDSFMFFIIWLTALLEISGDPFYLAIRNMFKLTTKSRKLLFRSC